MWGGSDVWKEWQSHSDGPIPLTSWLQKFTVSQQDVLLSTTSHFCFDALRERRFQSQPGGVWSTVAPRSSVRLNWSCCFTSTSSPVDNNEVIPLSISLTHMAKAVKYSEDMIVFLNVQHWGPLRFSHTERLSRVGATDGSQSEVKWADGAWFSFLLACGWCNWSRQSEDGMIPPPLLHLTETHSSPRLPGSRAVE